LDRTADLSVRELLLLLLLKAQLVTDDAMQCCARASIYRKDVRLPVQLQRAMAAEAEAAREARAKVKIMRWLQLQFDFESTAVRLLVCQRSSRSQ